MKNKFPAAIWIPLALLSALLCFNYIVEDFTSINKIYLALFFVVFLVLLLIIEYLSQIINIFKYKSLTEEEKQIQLEKDQKPWHIALYDSIFTKQSDQEEEEIIIDHGFDGIKELDNALPKWWLGLFYLGIVYAVFWWTNYFVLEYPNPDQEYTISVEEEAVRFAEWEKTAPVVNLDNAHLLVDETSLTQGKDLFNSVCATCHEEGGLGATGPNLTDGYWKNHREEDLYKNIYSMIAEGKLAAGMPAWSKENDGQFLGYKIEKIASYVYSLSANTRTGDKNIEPVSGKVKEGTAWKGTYPDSK